MTDALPHSWICETACRHGVMRYAAGDDTVGRSLALYGEWAEAEVALFKQIVRNGDTVIDAGANIGTHTVALAQIVGKHGRVHAFEPLPFNHALLEANLAANGLTWVDRHQTCVGAAPGTVAFPVVTPDDVTNMGAVGFYLTTLFPGVSTIACPMVSIDSLSLPRVDFIKIDVEGHELEVLDGAAATIAAKRPALFVEAINAVAEQQGEMGFVPAIIERLRPHGYSFWHYITPLFNPGNWRGNHDNIFEDFWSFDLLCVPRERFVVVGLADAENEAMAERDPARWRSAAVLRI